MSDYARTSAHALADLLRAVRAVSPQKGLGVAWAQALEAEYGTVEFDRRHTQCFALLNDTIASIDGLDERKQRRYLRYVNHWWNALVTPTGSWQTAVAAGDVITKESLDILDGLGDVQESAFVGTSTSPASTDLGELYDACSNLIELIEDSASLSDTLKRRLSAQVDHVRWLIHNVNVFGYSAPLTAAESAMGTVAGASASVKSPEERSEWKTRLMALGTAILVACGIVQTGAEALGAAMDSVTGVIESGDRLINGVNEEGVQDGVNEEGVQDKVHGEELAP